METEEAQDLRLYIQIYSISKIHKEFIFQKNLEDRSAGFKKSYSHMQHM